MFCYVILHYGMFAGYKVDASASGAGANLAGRAPQKHACCLRAASAAERRGNSLPKHLPNVEALFHCSQAFLSLEFLCRMDKNRCFGIEKSCLSLRDFVLILIKS